MTPRPPTHREPNKAECRKMPPGSLSYDFESDKWQYLEGVIGREIETPEFFAVPITGQEAKQEINWNDVLPSIDELKTIYEAERKRQVEGRGLPAVTAPIRAIRDAMIAAIKNQTA